MSRRNALRLAGLSGVAVAAPAVLTGCGTASGAGGDGTLRVAQTADPITLDPHKQGDMVSMNVLVNIFDTLTTRDVRGRLAARLALSWEARSKTVWRFRLRKGVRFHNGEEFDAEAVKFSIERILDPKTRSPIVELRYVTSVSVVDRYTVDVHTKLHDPILPAKLSLFGGVIVPPKHIADVGDAAFAKRPVGTGPYRFSSFRRDRELELRANKSHFHGRPGAERLVFRPLPNPASALAALQSDEVDIVTGLTPDAARQLSGYAGVELESHPGIRTAYLNLDTEAGPLRDRRVRQAINHAIDVPLLIKAVLDGKAREVPAMIPHGAVGFDKSIEPFRRSVRKAKQLLADAGHPDGISTTLAASNTDGQVAEAIAGLLRRAGIRARVELLDPGTFSARLTSDNRRALGPMYLAASTVWTLDGSSMLQSNVRHDRRQSRWTSKEADRLVDAEELSMKPEDRERAFSELQRLMKTEAPFVSLYQQDNILARTTRVRWTPIINGSLAMESAEVKPR
ncbi:ABC transporter substrate-binding protein [Streptomyces boninensis]|uniref:ABC transporter substrate-binding protein n=1 Tax=Streptomyces boninensis TaxID=2039455 RepID=UPI003B223E0A